MALEDDGGDIPIISTGGVTGLVGGETAYWVESHTDYSELVEEYAKVSTKEVREREYADAKEAAKQSLREEVKCGVSSCHLYGTDMSQNCFASDLLSGCRAFTQERVEEEIEEIVDGGSDAGKTRKIYF